MLFMSLRFSLNAATNLFEPWLCTYSLHLYFITNVLFSFYYCIPFLPAMPLLLLHCSFPHGGNNILNMQ